MGCVHRIAHSHSHIQKTTVTVHRGATMINALSSLPKLGSRTAKDQIRSDQSLVKKINHVSCSDNLSSFHSVKRSRRLIVK